MSQRRVAVLISGAGSNMGALLRAMGAGHPARPVLVVADRAGAGGLALARELGVKVAVVERGAFAGRSGWEAALQAELDAAGADLLCLAGFMRVLSADFVALWEGRALNIHPSLLPLYPGLQTHARALAAGDVEAGCTVHEVTADLDAGPILGRGIVPVYVDDTEAALAARVLRMEHRLYPAVLERFAAGDRQLIELR